MSLPATRVVALGGSTIEVARAGEGPPIVLVNGAGGPIEGWLRIFDPLSKLGTVMACRSSPPGAATFLSSPNRMSGSTRFAPLRGEARARQA